MNHPFMVIFNAALRKSNPEENLVLKEAVALRKKGYPAGEIQGVLKHLQSTLLDDQEIELVREAVEEMDAYSETP